MKLMILFFCIFVATTVTVHAQTNKPTLPTGIYALEGIDITKSDDTDLENFMNIVKDAKNIGLGESVHTSGGYHDAKFRLIRFLIEKKGFRVLAMETPRIGARKAAEYIEKCIGDSKIALTGIFSVFGSTTTQKMFEWLCEYNRKNPQDPVQFFGFDTQEPDLQKVEIKNYLLKILDPAYVNELTSGLDSCYNYAPKEVLKKDKITCQTTLNSLKLILLNNNSASYIRRTSKDEFTWINFTIDELSGWADQVYYQMSAEVDNAKSFEVRDFYMAETLKLLRASYFPSKKMIIWAHNFHLEESEARGPWFDGAIKNMGSHLKKFWNKDYAAIGLVSYRTKLNWPSAGGCMEYPVPTDSNAVESKLFALNSPYLMVNLNSDATNDIFNKDGNYPYGGPQGSDGSIHPKFTGLIYLEQSDAMISPFWSRCN